MTTLLYLLDDENGDRHTSYVEDSLVAERELLKNIQQRQKDTGEVLPIEERIRRSIEESAKAAGIDPLLVLSRKKIGWPSAEVRARELGPTAYAAYRMGSGALHGTWHTIYRHYVREVEGGFECTLDPPAPRPQPLLTGTLLITEATGRYLDAGPAAVGVLIAPQLADLIAPQLADLWNRTGRVEAMHESFLQERRTRSSE